MTFSVLEHIAPPGRHLRQGPTSAKCACFEGGQRSSLRAAQGPLAAQLRLGRRGLPRWGLAGRPQSLLTFGRPVHAPGRALEDHKIAGFMYGRVPCVQRTIGKRFCCLPCRMDHRCFDSPKFPVLVRAAPGVMLHMAPLSRVKSKHPGVLQMMLTTFLAPLPGVPGQCRCWGPSTCGQAEASGLGHVI